jgi:predicted CoA-binding protein
MSNATELIQDFLKGKRIAVAGVSRSSSSAANAVFRKMRTVGYEVFPVNPNASHVEGVACFPNLQSVPVDLDGVVAVTHPDASIEVVRQAAERKVSRIWLHRSFGQGSVSEAATRACRSAGIRCIVGGCPLMYCAPIDFPHRCMRWWLDRRGRIVGG